jgi:5'-3' exonuclease
MPEDAPVIQMRVSTMRCTLPPGTSSRQPRGGSVRAAGGTRLVAMAHRMLLDTSSLTYRAYFALPSSITDPQGRPVNAVRGVLDMHARLLADHRPDEIVHVFDHDWRPAPRVAAYEGYKSDRPEEPEDLTEQFALLREVLAAFGLPGVEAEGWEADDAIGTLCTGADTGDRVDVVTGDRDLLQLVRDDGPVVRVLFTVKGVSELGVFDEAAVTEKYGVPPSRYVDFAILRGDPSDGLPGVKGVGEKTARQLVARYPTLGALFADADAQSAALARNLRASVDYVGAMQAIVPVERDVALTWSRPERDDAALDALAEARGLEGPVGRLREVLDA